MNNVSLIFFFCLKQCYLNLKNRNSIELNLRQGSNNPKTFYAIIHPYQPNSFVTFASDVAGNVSLDIENFLGLDDNLMTREQFLDLVGPNNFIENVLNLNLYNSYH